MCPHSSSVRPPPLPRARTTTLGRPGVASEHVGLEPGRLGPAATKRAISASPAPPGTSEGLTESMATSREVSSMKSARIGVGSRSPCRPATPGPRCRASSASSRGTACCCSGRRRASRSDTLGELPEGVKVGTRASGVADVIVAFHLRRAELAKRMPALRERMDPAAGLWIAWPKRASKVETDLTEDVVASWLVIARRADYHARRQQGSASEVGVFSPWVDGPGVGACGPLVNPARPKGPLGSDPSRTASGRAGASSRPA